MAYDDDKDGLGRQSGIYDRDSGAFNRQSGAYDRESGMYDREGGLYDRESGVYDRNGDGGFNRQSMYDEKAMNDDDERGMDGDGGSPRSAVFAAGGGGGGDGGPGAPPGEPPASLPRPFLTLGPRLWLTTFNPALFPMVFTVVHLMTTRSSTQELATSLRNSIISACNGVAQGATALTMIPRYLAMQTNETALKSARATVLGVGRALMYILEALAAIINFILDTYRSLLMCTLQLVVQAALEILIAAMKEITDALNAVIGETIDIINKATEALSTVVNGASNVANKIVGFFTGGTVDTPTLDIDIGKLKDFKIPDTAVVALTNLNESVPTLDELKDMIEGFVDKPFTILIDLINSTRLEIAEEINSTIFPTPSLTKLAENNTKVLQEELCGDLDLSIIDDTAKALYNLNTLAIWAMVGVVGAMWGTLAFWQWRRWKALQATAEVVDRELQFQPDAWTVVAVVENPMVERYGGPVFRRMSLSNANRLRWFLSYLGHPTSLTLLSAAVLGLLVIQVQIWALDILRKKAEYNVTHSLNTTIADFANKLNTITGNVSVEYATEMNAALGKLESRINGDMFGTTINHTAITLNDTLVEFYARVQSSLNTAFGSTILYNPINNFVFCILGSKIVALEKGLTWVSEHSSLSLPRVDDDVLQLSNASAYELAAPLAAAAIGGGDDETGVVGKLISHMQSALATERIMYGIMLLAYVLLFVVGLMMAFCIKPRKPTQRAGPSDGQAAGAVWDYADGPPPPNAADRAAYPNFGAVPGWHTDYGGAGSPRTPGGPGSRPGSPGVRGTSYDMPGAFGPQDPYGEQDLGVPMRGGDLRPGTPIPNGPMPSPLFERGYEERRGGGGGGGGGGRDDDYNLSAYDNYARYSVEESRGYPNMPAMRGSTEGDRENPFRDNNAFQDAEDDALTKERGHSLTILERLKAKLG